MAKSILNSKIEEFIYILKNVYVHFSALTFSSYLITLSS